MAASPARAQDDICVPTSFISDYCVNRDTGTMVEWAVRTAQDPGPTAELALSIVSDMTDQFTTGPDALVGGTVEKPYAAGAGCAYLAMDTADSATLRSDREAYGGACGRAESGDGNTYYAGSPGHYTWVPAHGVSNGHVLRVFENAYRAGQWACADIYVNSRGGGMYENTYHGLCGLNRGDLLFKGGYNRVGSSWCKAHPAGSSGEPNDPARGRCRYKYDG